MTKQTIKDWQEIIRQQHMLIAKYDDENRKLKAAQKD